MSQYKKFILKIGGAADAITITICLVLVFQYWAEGDIPHALLSLIAMGVWCISCTALQIKQLLEKR